MAATKAHWGGLALVLAVGWCLGFARNGLAETLTFDNLLPSGATQPVNVGRSIIQYPYVLESSLDLFVLPESSPDFTGSPAVAPLDGAVLTLRRLDGLPFDLLSVDVDELWSSAGLPVPITVGFTGYYNPDFSPTYVTQSSLMTDGVNNPPIQTVPIPNLSNVTKITWSSSGPHRYQLDNLVVASLGDALDEPALALDWVTERSFVSPSNPDTIISLGSDAWQVYLDDPNDPWDTADGVDSAMATGGAFGTKFLHASPVFSGELHFWWRKSDPADSLTFTVGTFTASATTDWSPVVINIRCGTDLQFAFEGPGAGFVDGVEYWPWNPLTVQPIPNQTVVAGQPLTIEVTAAGANKLFYQLVKNTLDGNGELIRSDPYALQVEASTFVLPGLEVSDSGHVTLTVFDGCADVVSTEFDIEVTPGPPSENLVRNGSFEMPLLGDIGVAGSSQPDWSLRGWQGHNRVLFLPTQDGDGRNTCDLTSVGAAIQQTFDTVPGYTYRVSLLYAKSFIAPDPTSSLPPISAAVRVAGNGGNPLLMDEVLTAPSTDPVVAPFRPFTRTFVADDPRTTLRLELLSTSDPYYGMRVDKIEVVRVNPANQPPVAGNDGPLGTQEDESLNLPAEGLLANDSDPENGPIALKSWTLPAHGTLDLDGNGGWVYTPDPDFHGTDEFTYRITDGQVDSDAATVYLIVFPVNDRPVAKDSSYQLTEDHALGTLEGAYLRYEDADGDPVSLHVVTPPAHGSVVLMPDYGGFTYTPAPDYFGSDSFTFGLFDGLLDSGIGTVTLEVLPQPDRPIIRDDNFTVAQNGTLTVSASGVLANDSDVDGDVLSASLRVAPTQGTVAMAADGSFVYTPNQNFVGHDQFTYFAFDPTGLGNEATVYISIVAVNRSPVVLSDAYTVLGGPLVVGTSAGVLSNDGDADGDSLTANLVTPPTYGRLNLSTDGSFTYLPNRAYYGQDSFSYRASDGKGGETVATVTLSVRPDPDVDGNGCVDRNDVLLLQTRMRTLQGNTRYDFNQDGRVDIADTRWLALHFTNANGTPCNP